MDRETLIRTINDYLSQAEVSDLELILIFVGEYVRKTEKRREVRT